MRPSRAAPRGARASGRGGREAPLPLEQARDTSPEGGPGRARGGERGSRWGSERASERERMREKVRVRAACVLVGAKVWRERVGARRSVAGEEVCRGAPRLSGA